MLDHGERTKIKHEVGISRPTILKVLKEHECKEATFIALAEYFNAKKARLDALA